MIERIIALWMGPSGVGKSFAVANLHNALIFDTDLGGGLAYAEARIARNKSERIQAISYVEVLNELKTRQQSGRLKDITTLVLDHVSTMQQESVNRHNPSLDRDYGRANDMATKEWRKIREFVRNFDFNLICTAHLKAKWEAEKVVGIQADGAKNLEGDFGIVLQLRECAKYPSTAWVQKWRRDPEDHRGLIPRTFDFTMDEFQKLAGPGLSAPREPITLATPDQVLAVNRLLETVAVPEGTASKWLAKAGVEGFDDFPAADLQKCIDWLRKQTSQTNGHQQTQEKVTV